MNYHSDARGIAFNVSKAANYAAGLLDSNMNYYWNRGISDELGEAAGIRDYNASPGKNHLLTLSYLQAGTVSALDRRTTGHNYVTNVLAIAHNCFNF